MKKHLAIILCLCLLFGGCSTRTPSAQTETTVLQETSSATMPTQIPTETIIEKKEFVAGNLRFTLDGYSIYKEISETVTMFSLTPNMAYVKLECLGPKYIKTKDISVYALSRQEKWSESSSEIYSRTKIRHTVSEDNIYFVQQITDGSKDNPPFWEIGTFHDGEYIYTITYCTFSNNPSESEVFSKFLSTIQSVSSEIKLDSAITEEYIVSITNTVESETYPSDTQNEEVGTTYILNKNTKKFHYPSCSSAKKMKETNKSNFTGLRDDVIAKGYDPCNNCNP